MDDEDLDLSAQLSAWTAPPAPHNLADRVIARVTATDEAIAVVTQRRRTQRRWWLAGGLAAVLAGAAIALVTVPRHAAPSGTSAGSGTAIATWPQQLAFPGAIANLDPGTDVSWQTSGTAIHVQQRSGAATWRVDKPELFLDVGAAVASIEASNATLRVETHMNLTDARLITTAAVTSAAVAFVTVAVYEGHVKLSGAGQTIVVAPGSTYEVRPGQPPIKQIDEVDRALDEVQRTVAGTPPPPAPPVRTAPRPHKDRAATVGEFEAQMKLFEPALDRCVTKWTTGETITLEIAATGNVTGASTTFSDPVADGCLRRLASGLKFSLGGVALRGTYYLEPCNAEKLQSEGIAATARGENAPALKSYEAALACKYDTHTLALAFMASCRAGDLNAARRHWKTMNPDMKTHYVEMCIHEHITREQLDE
jgi:hypothetical protein